MIIALSFGADVPWTSGVPRVSDGDGRFSLAGGVPVSQPARAGSPGFERDVHEALASPHSSLPQSLRPPLLDAAMVAIDELRGARTRKALASSVLAAAPSLDAARRASRARLESHLDLYATIDDDALPPPKECLQQVLGSQDTVRVDRRLWVLPYLEELVIVTKSAVTPVPLEPLLDDEARYAAIHAEEIIVDPDAPPTAPQ